MHICVYLFYFYYYIFCYIPLRGAKKKKKKAVLLASEAKLPKQQVIESPGLFCPGSFYPLSSTPFSLGIKGSALSVKNHAPWRRQHVPPITHLFFSVNQSEAVSFLRASLENCGWWVVGGSEWDARLSGTATENKCFQLVKTPDFGIVVSMILNYMQRARGSSIYPYHLQFLLSVILSMYLGVE